MENKMAVPLLNVYSVVNAVFTLLINSTLSINTSTVYDNQVTSISCYDFV